MAPALAEFSVGNTLAYNRIVSPGISAGQSIGKPCQPAVSRLVTGAIMRLRLSVDRAEVADG